MRVAIVSDIHGNLAALEAIVTDLADTAPDMVVHGGDLVLNGSSPAAVVDLIQSLGWPGVVGNTDELLWRPELLDELLLRAPDRGGLRRMLFQEMAPATRDALGSERIRWLSALPRIWSTESMAVVHATPMDLWRAPMPGALDEELASAFAGLERSVVVYAHVHRGYVRRLDALTVGNSGSVSLSYDGDPRPSYLIVDEGVVSLRRLNYDVDCEIRALRQLRYPNADWLISILQTGVYTGPVAAR